VSDRGDGIHGGAGSTLGLGVGRSFGRRPLPCSSSWGGIEAFSGRWGGRKKKKILLRTNNALERVRDIGAKPA